MNVAVDDTDVTVVIEFLTLVADLCEAEPTAIGAAIGAVLGADDRCCYDAAELRGDLLEVADFLARAIGFPDADMDPGKPLARSARWAWGWQDWEAQR